MFPRMASRFAWRRLDGLDLIFEGPSGSYLGRSFRLPTGSEVTIPPSTFWMENGGEPPLLPRLPPRMTTKEACIHLLFPKEGRSAALV